MHYLLKNVYIYFLSDLAMLIQLLDPSLYPDLWGLFWAKSHPPSKFPKNLFSNFCVILLTTQPTNKRTWAKNMTSLADAMEKYCPSAKNKEQANELIWITRMSDTIGWRWNNWQIFPCYTHRCLEGRTLCKNLFVKCMFRAMRRTCLISNWGVISVVSV